MCKWSDPFSKRVLIGRGLDHNSLEYLKSTRSSSDYSVLKARPSKKYWTRTQQCVILGQSYWSVTMTVRFHLFPFRTQKLSLLVPKIVRWKRRVKIGSRRLDQKPSRIFLGGFAFAIKRHLESCTGKTDGCVWYAACEKSTPAFHTPTKIGSKLYPIRCFFNGGGVFFRSNPLHLAGG